MEIIATGSSPDHIGSRTAIKIVRAAAAIERRGDVEIGGEQDRVIPRAAIGHDPGNVFKLLRAREGKHGDIAAAASNLEGFVAIAPVGGRTIVSPVADIENEVHSIERAEIRWEWRRFSDRHRRNVREREATERVAWRVVAPKVVAGHVHKGCEACRDLARHVENAERIGQEGVAHLVEIDLPVRRRFIDDVVEIQKDLTSNVASPADGREGNRRVDRELKQNG